MGRVNSFITGEGGARKADKDLWKDAKGQLKEKYIQEKSAKDKQWVKFLKDAGKQPANDPKSFVKDAYDKGFNKEQIVMSLQAQGNHDEDDAETYYYNIVGQYE